MDNPYLKLLLDGGGADPYRPTGGTNRIPSSLPELFPSPPIDEGAGVIPRQYYNQFMHTPYIRQVPGAVGPLLPQAPAIQPSGPPGAVALPPRNTFGPRLVPGILRRRVEDQLPVEGPVI